ncbi:AMP-binding protein [Cellulophaga baltica]|uniref:AMP-binding protein n=1 Tax=Cellulophaga TaxID=104264 RepID=UPI001C0752D3|nr:MULTISPECIES: AMP-binding protein [Cellulophaga]MBU2996107.1 AMP-binding protein [Cellulophaga baltica]MDO6767502.1 AMP-binding protein [Cellulophaga sp. 1_MG-2023]
MQVSYKNIHPEFRLNGLKFSKEDLSEVGYSLIKEGETFEIAIGNFLLSWSNDSPVLEVNTSGSTGVPKTIILEKQYMVNSAIATGEFFNLKPTDTALLCLPCNFIAGKMMLVRAMILGLQLDYVPSSSEPLKDVVKAYDFGAMIPLQLENSLVEINQIKKLIVGGAKMSDNLISQIQGLKTMVYETYGMTETITHIAIKKANHKTYKIENFRALPNVRFSVDGRGCLVIDAENISDEKVVTNDLVNLLSDKEFEWLGRFDSVINSGGIKLFPEKIESKLSSLIHENFFVAGIPDAKLGQKLVLLVEGNIDAVKTLESIKLLKSLGKFEIPKEIFTLDSFVWTDNGKIQRSKTIAKL